jgi:hypothetical protein
LLGSGWPRNSGRNCCFYGVCPEATMGWRNSGCF